MATDARCRMKYYLDANIVDANLTKDNDVTQATWITCYASPPYPLVRMFSDTQKSIEIVFALGDPDSTPRVDCFTRSAYAYDESVPIWVYCVDKAGVTGATLKWKAEKELRRVVEAYPTGSVITLEKRRDTTEHAGAVTLYSLEFRLMYARDVTT